MKTIKNAVALLLAATVMSATVGCSSIERLEANARKDRAENPEKYQEIPEIARQQMTANQQGVTFPEFCTWGCPAESTDLTRAW